MNTALDFVESEMSLVVYFTQKIGCHQSNYFLESPASPSPGFCDAALIAIYEINEKLSNIISKTSSQEPSVLKVALEKSQQEPISYNSHATSILNFFLQSFRAFNCSIAHRQGKSSDNRFHRLLCYNIHKNDYTRGWDDNRFHRLLCGSSRDRLKTERKH